MKKVLLASVLAVSLILGSCSQTPPTKELAETTRAQVVKESETVATEKTETSFEVEQLDQVAEPVRVSGEFTVTVWEMLPDYVLDDETPRVLYVAGFQMKPFLLSNIEDFISEIGVGNHYKMTIEPKDLGEAESKLYRENRELIEALSIGEKIALFDLSIGTVEEVAGDSVAMQENKLIFEG